MSISSINKMNKLFLNAVFLIFICFSLNVQAADSSDVKNTEASQIQLKNYRSPAPMVHSGGQPSEQQLQAFAALGVKNVINLRPVAEQTWDESASVGALGMNYVSIPVEGAAGITWDNAAQLKSVLDASKNSGTLLHCASGNRVGALMALNASRDGADLHEAIKIGKAWGMTGLESKVREVIQAAKH